MSRSIARSCLLALLAVGTAANVAASTYTVNSLDDPGDGVCDVSCTLRDAILAANENPGRDVVDFSGIVLRDDTVPVTIVMDSQLPVIKDRLILDASIKETRDLPGAPKRRPGVELDYALAAPKLGTGGLEFYPDGLTLAGPDASGSEVRGFIINSLNQVNTAVASSHGCQVAASNPDPTDPSVPEIGHCGFGIHLFGVDDTTVAGNYINFETDGITPDGDGDNATGIMVIDGSGNVIGGVSANDRNVMTRVGQTFPFVLENMISLFSRGWAAVAFGRPKEMNDNKVIGNYIGLTANRDPLFSASRGIQSWSIDVPDFFFGSPYGWGPQCGDALDACQMKGNEILRNIVLQINQTGFSGITELGGIEDQLVEDNVIFGGGGMEIFRSPLSLTGPTNITVRNNYMNVDPEGEIEGGQSLTAVQVSGANHVLVEGNVFKSTLYDGVVLFLGEPLAQNVAVVGNSIEGVGQLGFTTPPDFDLPIQLVTETEPFFAVVNTNDELDVDDGVNGLQNMPALTEVRSTPGESFVDGFLHSEPNRRYRIDLYSNDTAGPSGHGELQSHLRSGVVRTDDDGNATFSISYDRKTAALRVDGYNMTHINATVTLKLCEPDGKAGSCVLGATSEPSKACAVDPDVGSAICPPDVHAPPSF